MSTMFTKLALASLICTTCVRSFQHSSFVSTSRTSSASFFALSSASFSQDLSSSTSPAAATAKSDIEIQKSNHDHNVQKRKNKRRRRKQPSQDVNFLLKRTQYLLDLTPSSLQSAAAVSSTGDKAAEAVEQSEQPNHKLKIHRHTFHWLIDAWANSHHPKATSYARALLDQMISLSSCSDDDDEDSSSSIISNRNNSGNHLQKLITPNVRSYTKVMYAYSKEGNNDSGEKAFKLLQEMMKNDSKFNAECNADHLKPNVNTYTSVLEAYANSGTPESAFRAEELCTDMIQKIIEKNGIELDNVNASDDIGSSADSELLLQPTTRSYNAVIQAYYNSGMYDRAERAEAFIKQIEALHQKYDAKQQDESEIVMIQRPNTINYNTLLTTYANSGLSDAAEHTERILKKVMTQPNVISYNACIDAWAKSGYLNSGEKAFALLQEMKDLYESTGDENLKPNSRSYNSVMNAFAKSASKDGPQKAEQILDTMEELFEQGNVDVKPDFFSFATVINAWGRSYQYGKAQRVLNIFRHMIDLYKEGNESVRPNGKSYYCL